MTLLNGSILAVGALLMAVPVILHLLMQPKPKPIVFPALRFVVRNQRANQRQWRLKNWMLLLLRCLAIAAVAAALSQPSVASSTFGSWLTLGGVSTIAALLAVLLGTALLWMRPAPRLLIGVLSAMLAIALALFALLLWRIVQQSPAAVLGDRAAPVNAVILIDNSPRMSYRTQNQTALERAKELGAWLITQFPADSKVSIVTPDGDDPFYSVDLNAAKKRLETLEIVYRDVSIPDALVPGLQLLATDDDNRREMYIVTDMGRSSWSVRGDAVREALADRPDVSLYLVDVGADERPNIRLAPLELASSSITPAGQLEVSTTIESNGFHEPRVAQLKLEQPDPTRPVRRDNKTLLPESHWQRSATVELADDRADSVSFRLGQLPVGVHHGWVEIEGGDALPLDNRRYFSIEVRPAWKTLVVHPANVSPDNFVETVAPLRQREAGVALFDCEVIDQSELSSHTLSDYRLVVLLNPQPLADAVWTEFKDFVDQGGGFLCCLGHNAAQAGGPAPEFNSAAAQQILPGELSEIWRNPQGDVFLSPVDFSHPILSEFRRQSSSIRWNRLPVYFHWGFQPSAFETGDPVEVLLRYSNRRPAMIEKQIGRGRAIVMTTPITEPPRPSDHPSWNELFYGEEHWASWLLILQTAQYLVHTSAPALNYDVDQVVALDNTSPPNPADYWLFSPRDEEPQRVAAEGDQIRYRFTNVPGNYRLRGTDGENVLRGFSVNVQPEATNLRRIEPAQLDQILGEGRYRLARGQAEIEREQGVARIGQEFYPILALIVASLLAIEFLLATLFYRTRAKVAARSLAPNRALS